MTPKESAFVREYPIDHNGTQAAIRAGYSPKGARVRGSELLARRNVREAIEAQEAQHQLQCSVTVEGLTRDLQNALDLAMKNDQPSAAVSAAMAIAKLHGLEAAPRANENAPVNYVVEAPRKPKTDAEWLASTGHPETVN